MHNVGKHCIYKVTRKKKEKIKKKGKMAVTVARLLLGNNVSVRDLNLIIDHFCIVALNRLPGSQIKSM